MTSVYRPGFAAAFFSDFFTFDPMTFDLFIFDPLTCNLMTFDPVTFDLIMPMTSRGLEVVYVYDLLTCDPMTSDALTFDLMAFDPVTARGFAVF